MTRRCFYSFHYKPDNWRAAKIRNIGAIEGNKPATDNDWETITSGGDAKIKKWINEQLSGRTCTIVLVGRNTAKRKWIDYEIQKSWNDGKGVLGIHIHNVEDSRGNQAGKGANPFSHFTLDEGKKRLTSVVKCYDPPRTTSSGCYNYIADHLEDWVEEAIKIRDNYSS